MPKKKNKTPPHKLDWSHLVSESLQGIVRTTDCPKCGSKAKMPCANRFSSNRNKDKHNSLSREGKRVSRKRDSEGNRLVTNRKTKDIPFYYYYVHSDRKRVFDGLKPRTNISAREAVVNGDWSRWPLSKLLANVNLLPCPKCGVPKGVPCAKRGFTWNSLKKFKPNPALHMRNRVHTKRYPKIDWKN